MIEIDGSYGEGGGQILRTALFLSLLTQKPFRAFNIRKGRSKPGLKPQHLHIIKALLELTDSRVEGAREGSLSIKFYPGPIRGGRLRVDIGTAGSIPLFLQTLLPVSFFAERDVDLTIRGGTDVSGSMTADYFAHVLLPHVRHLARKAELHVIRRGFYPRGGGEIRLLVRPRLGNLLAGERTAENILKLNQPFSLDERGELKEILIFSLSWDGLKNREVAERQARAAVKAIKMRYPVPVREKISYFSTLSPGTSITLVARFKKGLMGSDGLGKKGKPAEKVGEDAALKLIDEIESGATVDVHLCDNLIPYLALFGGRIKVREISSHTRSNIWISEKFLGKRFVAAGNLIEVPRR